MEGVTVHFKLDDIVISLSLLVTCVIKLTLTTLKWLKYDGMAGNEDACTKRHEEHGTHR